MALSVLFGAFLLIEKRKDQKVEKLTRAHNNCSTILQLLSLILNKIYIF